MRNLNQLNKYRLEDFERAYYGTRGDHGNGVFAIISPIDGEPIKIIASTGEGWEHVSASRADRVPNHDEMELVARLFFQGHEAAVQFHVPAHDHVSNHPHCLHWWRPTREHLPRPPRSMV